MNSSGITYGIEAALQCPLLCTKKNYIRQQLSFLYYNDSDFTYWNLTLNPEYRFVANPGFELAAGPSLGISNSKIEYNSDMVADFKKLQFTYGASSSATWHFGKVFVALSARYMLTGENEIGGITNANFNNFQGLLKFGSNL